METFKIYLNPLQKQTKYQPYLLFFGALTYIVLGIINLIDKNVFGWVWISLGIIYFFLLYYQKNYSTKYFFEIQSDSIRAQQSAFKKSEIKLNNIKEIYIKPISIEFILSDNAKEEILLGNTSYKNVIDIKSKLREIAKEKNIKIN
jgi:hypothetical protein